MRLKRIEINPSIMKLEIEIIEQKWSFSIVLCNGKARMNNLPDHGGTKIITFQI